MNVGAIYMDGHTFECDGELRCPIRIDSHSDAKHLDRLYNYGRDTMLPLMRQEVRDALVDESSEVCDSNLPYWMMQPEPIFVLKDNTETKEP